MNKDLLEQLDVFYELEEQEQEAVLAEVLLVANSDKEAFAKEIQQADFDEVIHLPIFYEAMSRDMGNWADFFLSEFKRVLSIAKSSQTPADVLCHLDEFVFILFEDFKYRNEFAKILKQELSNSIPVFRYYALSLLPEFADENDYEMISQFRAMLHDQNWKIRYWAYLSLRDLDHLESGDKLSFLDKFKAKYFNPLKFD